MNIGFGVEVVNKKWSAYSDGKFFLKKKVGWAEFFFKKKITPKNPFIGFGFKKVNTRQHTHITNVNCINIGKI